MIDFIQPVSLHSLLIAHAVTLGFIGLLFVLTRLVPGRVIDGMPLPDGTRVRYPLNGFAVFLITTGLAMAGHLSGIIDLSWAIRNFWSLLIAANVFSVAHTIQLYFKGPDKDKGLIKDLWYGTELNPTVWNVDLKTFAYRPSLVGLAVLNLSFGVLQYELYGELSVAMWVYQGLTYFYLAGSFQYEDGLLSMWDVIEERFGFMLVWGDYALVPFFYCIPAWFLVHEATPMPLWVAAMLTTTCLFGFWMFRGANWQKNRFKRDPQAKIWGRTPETIGGRLLVSGFWGIGRKLNYSGEILMYLSWTLTTGFQSPIPYLLPLWLISLLLHRAHRDDKRCRAKYGPLWEEYCQRARFRMIPFIY